MKPKYIAGFFAFLLLILLLLAAGYQMSYRAVMDRQAARSEEHAPVSESISAEGEAVKEENPDTVEGYYICELHGFVVVYLGNRTTIYELTEIPTDELPDDVAAEVKAGKYAASEGELYAFLENYSS